MHKAGQAREAETGKPVSVRKTISMPFALAMRAELLRTDLAHPDLSSLIQALIREEWERRHGPMVSTPDVSQVSSAHPFDVQAAADKVTRDIGRTTRRPRRKETSE
jgi:hypothetical protein